jgi:predicted methyltransferase MtxX (methanogen marker protein 4)
MDVLLQTKGDHLDRVPSDQMVLEMIRQGRLDQYIRSSVEAKSLITGLKGPSDYYSNEIVVKVDRSGASGPN